MSEKTQNWWDRTMGSVDNAKTYIRSYGEGVDFPSRMELLEWIEDGESLLDVGCGSGCEWENIKKYERDIKYKGTDYSELFIQGCTEMFPEVEWEVQDSQKMTEADGSWDTVLLRHMLECLPYYEDTVNEAWRVAKKQVVIVFWIPPHEGGDIIGYAPEDVDDRKANIYNREKFMAFIENLSSKVTVKENVGKSNMFIVIEKEDEDTILS